MVEFGYLLDTCTLSVMRRENKPFHQAANEWVKGVDESRICISVITLSEVKFGLELAKPDVLPPHRKKEIQEFVNGYYVLGMDKNTSKYYGEIRSKLYDKYARKDSKNKVKTGHIESLRDITSARELGIQENDLWIACIAVQYNLELITLDSGGMRRIVEVANYEEQTTFLKD